MEASATSVHVLVVYQSSVIGSQSHKLLSFSSPLARGKKVQQGHPRLVAVGFQGWVSVNDLSSGDLLGNGSKVAASAAKRGEGPGVTVRENELDLVLVHDAERSEPLASLPPLSPSLLLPQLPLILHARRRPRVCVALHRSKSISLLRRLARLVHVLIHVSPSIWRPNNQHTRGRRDLLHRRRIILPKYLACSGLKLPSLNTTTITMVTMVAVLGRRHHTLRFRHNC
mmetsp:Transcript_15041/g.29104  ORF Transcript_15041/g.29104 Transcript_15041/m.29104 type:complete len:227 (-) Transcript_15041:316-996(-)